MTVVRAGVPRDESSATLGSSLSLRDEIILVVLLSSAFACAWGLFIAMPDRKRYGWIVAVYAFSVAIATIYGRYHFATDALAGLVVSFLAFSATRLPRSRVY